MDSSQSNTFPVIPSVLVSLNASTCMCSSLQHLASISGHNDIETECNTNEACDGVRCQLNIIGNIFYLETIVLPCEDALEIVVEDSRLTEIESFRFNQSERRNIVVSGFPLTVDMTLIRREYSMFLRVRTVVFFIKFPNLTHCYMIIIISVYYNCTTQCRPSGPLLLCACLP